MTIFSSEILKVDFFSLEIRVSHYSASSWGETQPGLSGVPDADVLMRISDFIDSGCRCGFNFL